MAYLALVQDHQPFENLRRDVPRVRLRLFPMLGNILGQIAVLDILHRDMQGIRVLEPTQERYEQRRVLIMSDPQPTLGRIPHIHLGDQSTSPPR